MSSNNEEIPSPPTNRKDVAYSINSYEDTRNANIPVSYDPTDYIQKARVTRAQPPKPAYDPLQFVQLKPCSLVKTAQEQMKKVDVVKKVKDEKKEEPEEWQCNLDNWKSSRRKRVEHIIDRVVEVKKLELEEHDRNRRKSKTFNEMMEDRSSRRMKFLPIYTDDDNNDLSDLGISTSESSSQIVDTNSEDTYNAASHDSSTDTELNEYTYEGAIEDYKSRISRATHLTTDNNQRFESNVNQKSFLTTSQNTAYSCKETRLATKNETNSFETLLPEVPKIEVLKRKQLFEREQDQPSESESRRQSSDFVSTLSIKERLSVLQLNQAQEPNESDKYQKTIPDVSFTDLKNRLEIFEREIRTLANDKEENSKSSPQKSSAEASNTLEHNGKRASQSPDKSKEGSELLDKATYLSSSYSEILKQKATLGLDENENIDTDREDSGIHTTDVSCSVSQADDQNEEVEQLTNEDSDIKTDEIMIKGQSSALIEEVTQVEADDTNDINILDDALEMAFQEIDNMESTAPQPITPNTQEPIYQNISDINDILPQNTEVSTFAEIEPYYQVPKSQEPYYEVPKTKPIPLYENVDIMHSVNIISEGDTGTNFTINLNQLQPPKEKPPPPPVDIKQDAGGCNDSTTSNSSENFKRINSTKRIKKELHNKRSSFLGIDTDMADDDRLLNFPSATPSRSVASFLQEEKQLEKQFLLKTGLYDHSDAAESRDSGVSENHSRQSSDLFTTSSDDPEELIKPKIGENKISKYKAYSNNTISNNCFHQVDDEYRYQTNDTQLLQPEAS